MAEIESVFTFIFPEPEPIRETNITSYSRKLDDAISVLIDKLATENDPRQAFQAYPLQEAGTKSYPFLWPLDARKLSSHPLWFDIADKPFIASCCQGKPAIFQGVREVRLSTEESVRIACFKLIEKEGNVVIERNAVLQPTIKDIDTVRAALFIRDTTQDETKKYGSKKVVVLLRPCFRLERQIVFGLTGLRVFFDPRLPRFL